MREYLRLVLATSALLGASVAQAAVQYDFVVFSSLPKGPGQESFSGAFSYTAPSFITSDLIVPVGALSSCTAQGTFGPATCGSQKFLFSSQVGPYYTITFGIAGNANVDAIDYLFAGDFSRLGTQGSLRYGQDQYATITVSDLGAATPAVPEPTTWALFVLGFGLIGYGLRRSQAQGSWQGSGL